MSGSDKYGCETDKTAAGQAGLRGDAASNHGKHLDEVLAYWQSLRSGVAVPRRTDINPRAIKSNLEHAFILERVAPGMARFRVAGQHLNDLMGMDVRAMTISALFDQGCRTQFSDLLEEVFQAPARVSMDLQMQRRGEVIKAEMCLLPLRSDLGDVSRALGVVETFGPLTGDTPFRFEIAQVETIPLLGDNPKSFNARASRLDRHAQKPALKVAEKPKVSVATQSRDAAHSDEALEHANEAEIRDRIAKHRRGLLRVIEGGPSA